MSGGLQSAFCRRRHRLLSIFMSRLPVAERLRILRAHLALTARILSSLVSLPPHPAPLMHPLTRSASLLLLSVTIALGQSYTFTDLAGRPPLNATDDGVGSNARFDTPAAACVDPSGNIFIADTNNFAIRRITPAGVVTTFAGLGGVNGSADGTGENARFGLCWAIVADSAGNLIVADFDSHTIRRISPARVVTTIAGLAATSGSADGSAARYSCDGHDSSRD